jgi:hypothetical protein
MTRLARQRANEASPVSISNNLSFLGPWFQLFRNDAFAGVGSPGLEARRAGNLNGKEGMEGKIPGALRLPPSITSFTEVRWLSEQE